MSNMISHSTSNLFYVGVVENRMDPLRLGRCQVRIMGCHIHDKAVLPTEDLPWAYPLEPVTSAAMNGIGYSPVGPVEGTSVLIMFRDHPDNQHPIILGTIGGIPQKENVYIGSFDDDGITGTVVANPSTPGATTPGQETPIPTNQTEADQVNRQNEGSDTQQNPASSTGIPTTPPPWWRGDRAKAEQGIAALLAACDAAGLTTKEQKCTVLAIVGGECGWVPKSEGSYYSSTSRLTSIFSAFRADPALAQQYTAWRGNPSDFFEVAYGYQTTIGRSLGNTLLGDGGKYYGRGFIQLTGKSNYTRFAQLSGVDIVSNPDILNTDIALSAKVAATFIKVNTPSSVSASSHPGYFYAASRAVNPGYQSEIKQQLYEYFYGAAATAGPDVQKQVGSTPPPATTSGGSGSSAGSTGYTGSGGFVPGPPTGGDIGFKDPNKKYPLPPLINEPDTHRLARGIYKGTIVPIKEAQRDLGVPKALQSSNWDQPPIPYGAKYPFNHTYESESGHMQEFDDSPGYERMHRYHRKGTFEEIDANGTKVTRIVGDSYEIFDRNGCIHIRGECNITVDGNTNVFCRSDANIEVSGNARMEVGGNYDIGVVGNMTVAVGGMFNLWSEGNASFESASSTHITSESGMYLRSGGSTNITAGGDINQDAPNIWLNSGHSELPTYYQLPIPDARPPLYANIPYLASPVMQGEEVFKFETEEEWDTPEGREVRRQIIQQHGDQTPENTPAQEEAKPTGGSDQTQVASCAIVNNTQDFTADFRLSPNFTLGMLFDGGFNVRHRLMDQNGLTKQQIVCNLAQLANNILEKALPALPGGIAGYGTRWRINSGYRQGEGGSDHGKGRAVDIGILPVGGATRNQDTFNTLKEVEKLISYDQAIMEYRTPGQVWMHIGYRGTSQGDTFGGGVNRKMAFTMLNDRTYGQGFILL